MGLKRMFSTEGVKGTRGYLDTQKKYEILRTVLYFGISLSLFVAGYLQTGRRANLLSIVAILGCLPASKSAVGAIMFLRFRSCGREAAEEIERRAQGLCCLYDMVFTSEKRNFVIGHLTVYGNAVCGYAEGESGFPEKEFQKHIGDILRMDGHRDVTVKIFTDLPKYIARLEQMRDHGQEGVPEKAQAVADTLKSVAL